MSAIAGVFIRRGVPRRPGEVDQMLKVMASRGPDGAHTWTTDSIAFGHGALHATPESVGERMPLVDPSTGNVIVADVRLDNRAELLSLLGLDGLDPSQIGDGRLLLDAYRTWGEDCVDHLLGDFAFGIWDERRQRLFLARDHFGAKPLTYHSSEDLVAFASDSRAVVGLEGVPKAVNRDRVIDFLVDITELSDTTSTFFEHVHRLEAAHTLAVTTSEQRSRRYWTLPEPDILRLGSDAEYGEALREVLGLAVVCRLRGRDDVGAMLSGGIDSSSVAATAVEHGSLSTYSAVSQGRDCVETELVRRISNTLPIESHEADPSVVRGACGDFAASVRHMESPFENGALLRTMFSIAADDGRRSLLTGVYGDEVVGISAASAIRFFLDNGRLQDVVRLVTSDGNYRTASGRLGLARQAMSGLLDTTPLLGRRVAALRHTRQEAWRRAHVDELHLRLDSGERQRLDERLDATVWRPRKGDGPGSVRHRMFDDGFAAAALERYDRTAAMSSIESRSPFMDLRLVEFCLSLPPEQFVSGGWTKSVLRRCMVGRLPSEVIWNREKPDLGWSFTKEWVNFDPRRFLFELPSDHPLGGLVDVQPVINDTSREVSTSAWKILPYVRLALWLDHWLER